MGRKRPSRSAADLQGPGSCRATPKVFDVTEADGHHETVASRAEVYEHLSAGALWARESEALNWFVADVEVAILEHRATSMAVES